jgi:two-component system, sensor histidine kinase and response regulator
MRVNISTVVPQISPHPRVLLVADGTALHDAIASAGSFVIEQISDPAAALLSAERALPDAVVAVHDPDGPSRRDVFVLCAELKRSVESRLVPVIGIAATPGAGTAVAAFVAGLDHWFPSMPDGATLRARIAALLQSWGMYRAVEAKARGLMLIHDWVRYLVHDLRNPLGVAIGNINLSLGRLAGTPNNGEVLSPLADAVRALNSMSSMITDLLDSDRIRHGALNLKRDSLQLGPLVEDVVNELREESTRRRRPITVATSGDTTVDGDPTLLRRVCANLVENALRHSTAGSVEATVEGSMMEVIVRVKNQGPTISESLVEGLFDPWTYLGNDTFSLRTGLGLSFARIVVEAHGGRIWLESMPDGVVMFALAIPRAVAE